MLRNTGRCDSTTYCEACNGDDRYPHVGKPIVDKPQDKEGVLMSTYDFYDSMIIKLIDMNEGNSDDLSNCSFQCAGVPCSSCPARNDDDMTLGEIRAMDPRKPKLEKPEVTPTDDQPSTESIEGVTKPSHYMLFDDIEAIEVIARSMTREQFKGYCFGNILKYRLRAGKKSELAYLEKDMAKAGFYGELYEKHKDKCYDA